MDKQTIREAVWDALEASDEARFPYPPHGRIPNFAGADEAAERLTALDAWREADVIKANPDAPQLPVRRAALRQGKTLYMAVPRLRDEQCFLELDPEEVDDVDGATTVREIQVRDGLPTDDHDVPIDHVVTPERAVETSTDRPRPSGIDWDALGEDRLSEIPILQRLR
jgi:5-formyltetrahydrofolate cyclo-ligase